MGNLDKFINEWKVLESKMREQGLEVREWEEKHVGEVEAEQLKVCRIIRNYITHNPTDSFITRIDNTMIKWVKQFAKSLKLKKKSTKALQNTKLVARDVNTNQTINKKAINEVFSNKKNSKSTKKGISKTIKKELKVDVRKQSGNKKNVNKVKTIKRNSKASKPNTNKKQPKKLLLKKVKDTKKRTK